VTLPIEEDNRYELETRLRAFALKRSLSYAKKKTPEDGKLELNHEDIVQASENFLNFLKNNQK
jgi:hypothetical protein